MIYSDGTPEQAKTLYESILSIANQFLINAKMFEISILQDHNPTYEELAEIMKSVANIVTELADSIDPMLGTKALDYASIMHRMALAITSDDDVALQKEVCILETRPFS